MTVDHKLEGVTNRLYYPNYNVFYPINFAFIKEQTMETLMKYLQKAISSGSTLFVLVPIRSRKGQYCHDFCKCIYKINKTDVVVCCVVC